MYLVVRIVRPSPARGPSLRLDRVFHLALDAPQFGEELPEHPPVRLSAIEAVTVPENPDTVLRTLSPNLILFIVLVSFVPFGGLFFNQFGVVVDVANDFFSKLINPILIQS